MYMKIFEIDPVLECPIKPVSSSDYLDLYAEFVLALSEMKEIFPDPSDELDVFSEGQVNPKPEKGEKRWSTARTVSIGMDFFRSFDRLTDAFGDVGYAGAKIIGKIFSLISKIVAFVIDTMLRLPKFIAGLTRNAARLGKEKINRINGKMELYITYEDLGKFNEVVLGTIIDFITIGATFFSSTDWKKGIEMSDKITLTKMEKMYKKLSSVKYVPTEINLVETVKRDQYLNHNSPYYNNMLRINERLSTKKEEIIRLRDAFKERMSEFSGERQSHGGTGSNRDKAERAMQMVASVIKVLGEFYQCVVKDLQTINHFISKM